MRSQIKKSVRLTNGIVHVETPEGIINIQAGLHDAQGRSVTSVGMIPDRIPGQPKVLVRGSRMIRCKTARKHRYPKA